MFALGYVCTWLAAATVAVSSVHKLVLKISPAACAHRLPSKPPMTGSFTTEFCSHSEAEPLK